VYLEPTFGLMRLVLTITFLLSSLANFASHIVGGVIHYECLGGDQYEITLYVYRDCNPGNSQYDNNPVIGIYENSTLVTSLTLSLASATVSTLPLDTGDPCLVPPDNVCVQQAIYTGVVSIPPSAIGYTLAYQRCCRNTTILNVPAAGDNLGSTFFAQIPPTSQAICNSNPLFNNLPPVLLCANQPFVFDHAATDINGDSLAYKFCNPKDGGIPGVQMNPPTAPPYMDVSWNATFSTDYPITSAPAFALDPVTGLLTGTPNQVGQYVVGICVEEYRNGVLISNTNRDFQFNVVLCGQATIAFLDDLPQCQGLDFQFQNGSAGANTFFWDFGTVDNDTSIDANPAFTYPDTGIYVVTLVANPGGVCADTVTTTVYAYPPVDASFSVIGGDCGDGGRTFVASPDSTYGDGYTYNWSFGANANPPTSNDNNSVNFTLLNPGANLAQLEISVGPCSSTQQIIINVDPFPQAVIEEQTVFCGDLSLEFQNNSTNASTFLWNFGHQGNNTSTLENPSHIFPNTGTFNISLIADPGSDCADTALTTVQLLPADPITLQFSLAIPGPCDTINRLDMLFTGAGADEITWNTGDGNIYSGTNASYTYENDGFYTVSITAYNSLCDLTESEDVEIYISAEPLDLPLVLPNVFSPNRDNHNDTFIPFFELTPGVPAVLPGNRTVFDYLEDYTMLIYNRWGALIYDSLNNKPGWDGGDYPDGTYYAIISYKRACLDTKSTEKGIHFTLLR
jgi:PKD repeat protein